MELIILFMQALNVNRTEYQTLGHLIVHYTRISDPVFSANLYRLTEEGVFLIFSILGSLKYKYSDTSANE